jgi:hypothetical protein
LTEAKFWVRPNIPRPETIFFAASQAQMPLIRQFPFFVMTANAIYLDYEEDGGKIRRL